ncbi:MAG: heat-inducible transcriptional repressor HrcA [Bryobacteraceae bacterium]
MTPRHRDILHSIVETYIETGEPVPSRALVRRRQHHQLSAASIRNVMADLCDDGYLAQPHTSAGRIPTALAFQSYVQSLAIGRVLAGELARLRSELERADTLEARVERSSQILTELTQSVGIASAVHAASQVLDHVELLALSDHRVLMVVLTRDQVARNRVVALDEQVAQEELNRIRDYVNRDFAGWTLPAVQAELQNRLEQESAAYDAILRRLTVLYAKGLLDIGMAPEVCLEGASNLVGLDFHLTREKMREMFHALEEKKRILQLLNRFLEHPDGEVGIHVGLADEHPSLRELSLIGISVTLPSGLSAKIAVLGPIRMDYGKAMSAVLHVGQAFQESGSH